VWAIERDIEVLIFELLNTIIEVLIIEVLIIEMLIAANYLSVLNCIKTL